MQPIHKQDIFVRSCFYLSKRRQMQLLRLKGYSQKCCFYLSKRRQMQQGKFSDGQGWCCFYLSKRRQMQQVEDLKLHDSVVFTFQKEGRCNRSKTSNYMIPLFLPFKKKADATGKVFTITDSSCFYLSKRRQMQLLRLKGYSQKCCFYLSKRRQMQQGKFSDGQGWCCFYLSKRRQMQQVEDLKLHDSVVFTFQKEGRCNRQGLYNN